MSISRMLKIIHRKQNLLLQLVKFIIQVIITSIMKIEKKIKYFFYLIKLF